MKIEAELETVIEGKPLVIKYDNILFNAEENRKGDVAYFNTSSAMILCWVRFKNIKEFNLADLKEAFPEWGRYGRSSLLKMLTSLIREKRLMQCPNDTFKVINDGKEKNK